MKAGFNIFFGGKMLNAFFFCLADTIARIRLIAFFGAYRGIGDNGTCTLTGVSPDPPAGVGDGGLLRDR